MNLSILVYYYHIKTTKINRNLSSKLYTLYNCIECRYGWFWIICRLGKEGHCHSKFIVIFMLWISLWRFFIKSWSSCFWSAIGRGIRLWRWFWFRLCSLCWEFVARFKGWRIVIRKLNRIASGILVLCMNSFIDW